MYFEFIFLKQWMFYNFFMFLLQYWFCDKNHVVKERSQYQQGRPTSEKWDLVEIHRRFADRIVVENLDKV